MAQSARETEFNKKKRGFKKRSGKGRNYEKEQAPKECVSDIGNGKENDVSWYTAYPQLAKDAGSFSFFQPLGNDINFFDPNVDIPANILDDLINVAVPGVMVLQYQCVFGESSDFGSQLNIAARNIYSYLRSSNSGAKNYEPADLMMYLLAMDQAYAFYAWMVRVYGIMTLYSPTNKYYPNAILEALNIDFGNLQTYLPNFRAYINMFGAKLGKLCLPALMTITKRHQWLNSNIFLDSKTNKAQSYIFNPKDFLVWDETSNPNGSMLKRLSVPFDDKTLKTTFVNIKAMGESIISGLMSSEDVGTISGDILRAYGPQSIYKFGELPEAYQCLPVYSEEVLMQIENATLLTAVDKDTGNITQDVNKQAIISTPKITLHLSDKKADLKYLFAANRLLNVPIDSADFGVNYVASRFTATGVLGTTNRTSEGDNVTEVTLGACGTEILTLVIVSTRFDKRFIKFWFDQAGTRGSSHTLYPLMSSKIVEQVSCFRKHPTFWIDMANVDNVPDLLRIQDIDNYTILSYQELKQIHEQALLSELTMTSSQWVKK